ncbi:MAG: hypothetical protein IKR41_08125 [Bacteroidales bacterium]|nr:hypothetical protein [Bacteroidales bacterium]
MRKTLFNPKAFIAALMLSGAIIASCGDDEKSFSAVDNQNPTISLENETIHWEFAKEFRIKAKIDDADGIKTINLKNSDLFLNNTINILKLKGSDCKSYDLDYKFTVPDTLKSESFPIVITVEDLVGNVSSATFTASMDGDFTNPKFTSEPSSTINVIMTSFNLKFAVSDNKVIKRVTVKFPELNIDEEISNDSKEYEYKKRIELGDENRDYKGTIAAYDAFDNKVEKEITISKDELKDYERMYLSDVKKEADLTSDVCGVPMLVNHSGEFEYTAFYYNETAGTEIRFIPQKNSFDPICFGLDPSNNKILTPNPDEAQPLILDKEGVYYKIVFNTKEGTYDAKTTYTLEEAIDPLPHELGKNEWNHWEKGKFTDGKWEDDPEIDWQPFRIGAMTDNPNNIKEGYEFQYNPQNKHIIQILGLELEAGSFNFHPHIIHTDVWWDYASWKPESETKNDPEIWVWTGKYTRLGYENATTSYNNNVEVNNHAELTIPKTGKYDIIFDIHLGRMKIIPSVSK